MHGSIQDGRKVPVLQVIILLIQNVITARRTLFLWFQGFTPTHPEHLTNLGTSLNQINAYPIHNLP